MTPWSTYLMSVSVLGLGLTLGSCGEQVGPAGPAGTQGPVGAAGTPGTKGDPGPEAMHISSGATLPVCGTMTANTLFLVTQSDQPTLQFCDGSKWRGVSGDLDCPAGYDRDQTATDIVLCKHGNDEVVRVGSGRTAFWIDRYEASVWSMPGGVGAQYGSGLDDYPQTFPKNGQWTTPAYATSRAGVTPSRFLTWFQGNAACRLSGKRLPAGDEWLEAARGTVDPGISDGTGGACVTSAAGYRQTGMGTKCSSTWGTQDMIGNLSEMTSEWFAAPPALGASGAGKWPDAAYNNDGTVQVASSAQTGLAGPYVANLPAITLRGGCSGGGCSDTGMQAGIFAFNTGPSPAAFYTFVGFRCVIPH